ncbi:MAG: HEAT repeat domain-containing protein [Candidatus Micrarchaeia archaeon]
MAANGQRPVLKTPQDFAKLRVLLDKFKNSGRDGIEEKIRAFDHLNAEAHAAEVVAFGERALLPLLRHLMDGSANVKCYCIKCIAELKRSGKLADGFAAPFLSAMFLEDNGEVRDMATSALLKFGEDALPAALRALFSKNESARICAARVLSDLKRREVAGPLARAYGLEKNVYAKLEMATAIAGLEGKSAEQVEAELPGRLDALKQFDNKVKNLLEEIRTGDNGVAATAVRALAALGLDALIPIVWWGFGSESERVRAGAVVALAEMKSELALPFIAAKLADESEAVRRCACRALERFGGKALPWLLLMAEDGGAAAHARVLALNLIGRLGDNRMLEPLAGFLERDEPAEVRNAASDAVLAITNRAREAARERFIELAKDFFANGSESSK